MGCETTSLPSKISLKSECAGERKEGKGRERRRMRKRLRKKKKREKKEKKEKEEKGKKPLETHFQWIPPKTFCNFAFLRGSLLIKGKEKKKKKEEKKGYREKEKRKKKKKAKLLQPLPPIQPQFLSFFLC